MGGKYQAIRKSGSHNPYVSTASGLLFWFFTLTMLEVVLRMVVFDSVFERFGLVLGFNGVIAAILTLLTTVFPKKVNAVLGAILGLLLVFIFGSQIVYDFIFGSLYSVAQMQMGGAAVTAFWKETLFAMGDGILYLLMLLIPATRLYICDS